MGIDIKIDFDQIISVDELDSIQKESGIYVLMDIQKQTLYIGQSKNLTDRLVNHLSGKTNIEKIHQTIKYVALAFEEDVTKRLVAENYLINKERNFTSNVKNYFGSQIKLGEQAYPSLANKIFGLCKTIKPNGEKCKNHAHSNGFCHLHGGNGVTSTKLIAQIVEDYLSGKYQPDFEVQK